jgi:stearoyl-CoA desaturase (Delta-9 desaturase)
MAYGLLCISVFAATYLFNMFYTSVLFHRALAHGAVHLRPWTRRWVIRTGNWVTGVDPKTWICMHRRHHKYADTFLDPHSPRIHGVWAILFVQLRSYEKTFLALEKGDPSYTSLVSDLEFPIHWVNRKRVWFLPHLLHLGLAIVLGIFFHGWILGLGYFTAVMSHPFQGWAVNALGHRYGYRNFPLRDGSTNHRWVAWFTMGEGFQNNHHYHSENPNFAVRKGEIDWGYWLVRLAAGLGLLDLPRTPPPVFEKNLDLFG